VEIHPSTGASRAARWITSVFTIAAAVLLMLPRAAPAQDPQAQSRDWLDDPALQARLAGGKVVIRSSLNARAASASVDAAIRVHASPQAIWGVITQCRYAPILIPGLKGCKQLSAAADGSWRVVEHDIKYAPLLPVVHSICRDDLQPPLRMDFHRVAGDLKAETGSWILTPSPDGTTTVEYHVSMRPGFWVPRSIIRRSLKKQVPAALLALRAHAEGQSAANVASADDSTEDHDSNTDAPSPSDRDKSDRDQ
jgi:hypothetical protein